MKTLLRSLFGEIHWSPPGWCRWLDAHSKGVILAFLLLAIGCVATVRYLDWLAGKPKPRQIQVMVLGVELTPVTADSEKPIPSPLRILFGESVAPLEAVNKTVKSGITLSPAVAGDWTWASDRSLVFQPKTDWPAGQTYKIELAPTLVRQDVPLETYKLETTTREFGVKIREFEFYQDPKDPTLRQVVATLDATHPLRHGELENKALLDTLGKSNVFSDDKTRFTVAYGKHDREAYLRSAPLKLPPREDFAQLTLPKGLLPALGKSTTAGEEVAKTKLPDRFSFFKINSITGNIAHKDDGEPEQVLIVETTAEVDPEILASAIEVFLLPARRANGENWGGPRDVTPEILTNSASIPVALIPVDRPTTKMISFKLKLEQSGTFYVRIKEGIEALGGYPLAANYDTTLAVPIPPQELSFQSEGGLLALGGERRLSVKSRGLHGIHYEIARVRADQINHLVSQTRGDFQDPNFVSGYFDEENIARIAEEKQPIEMRSRFEANYSTFDFHSYLAKPEDEGTERGLFFLQARAWDPRDGSMSGPRTSNRFVLVTDLGLLTKFNSEGGCEVFVVSLQNGMPAADVQVELLAKNGIPLVTGFTTAEGRVSFPKLTDERREKEPVAFVAKLGDDISFLPYKRRDRELDFSRFDIGGISNINPEALDAFAFSERGIYRPGDTIHLAWAVKQRNWQGNLEGLPLELEVIDARGKSALVTRMPLTREAFSTLDFETEYESPAGDYTFNVYLVKDGHRNIRLGGTDFTVKEFQPDRMKLETRLNREPGIGWVTPDDLKAHLTLRNLYGTPASNRRITGLLTLSPSGFWFDSYPGYQFYDRLLDQKTEPEQTEIELAETTTDEEGNATVDFALEKFTTATWQLNYFAEAFEGNSGRSVSGQISALVSAQPWLIGNKPDGDLTFIQTGSERTVEYMAVNPTMERIPLESLEGRVIEQKHLSMLVKKPNGNYGYESIVQEKEVSRESLALSADGLTWKIPTSQPGNYFYEIWNADGERVSRVAYRVVGVGELTRSLDRNAELEIQLDKTEYAAGDTIQVSIRAPYTGCGLITIESNHVVAHSWFRTETASSIQSITLPPEFEGTGYVSVAFVRALDSREIFMSPLSYGVAPFKANFDKRRIPITLNLEKLVRPGEPLQIGYKTDRPSKIILFAVDKGILQVTNYQTPDPLEWFFRKTRLETRTTQIVDLLIPEYSLLREVSAPGGDGEEKLNPFSRVTEEPVVWWSGIVDADTTERSATYNVPDYFSGTLQVMAVAIAPDAVGSAEEQIIVRGPFILTPGMPTAVAPGDEFEVGVTVANNSAGSGPDAVVKLEVAPSSQLEIISPVPVELQIPENKEISTSVRVRVKEELGSGSLKFTASGNQEISHLTSTVSVRPATPFMVELKSANFKRSPLDLQLLGGWHEAYYEGSASVSSVPLGLARGLEFYLKNFPYGCTEQLVSGAFARMVLSDEADFGQPKALVMEQMNRTYSMLRSRQGGNGSFGYWRAQSNSGINFISVYAMQFLIEAKAAGFNPPDDLIQSGVKHLIEMAGTDVSSLSQARIVANAIYLLTRQETVTTNYLLNLEDTLNRRWPKVWQTDLTSSYIAASWLLLKKADVAEKLISEYKLGSVPAAERNDFYDGFSADSRYLALLARHFPKRLEAITPEQFIQYLEPIGKGNYSTLSAAYAILALKSYAQLVSVNPPTLAIQSAGNALPLEGKQVLSSGIPLGTKNLIFSFQGQPGPLGVFAQTMEGGFQINPPTAVVNQGMEVWRELIDDSGAVVNKLELGKSVTVRIVARSSEKSNISNVAIIDLVPGGFEVVTDSIEAGSSSLPGIDFVELREDRVVLFGSLKNSVSEWTYQLRPISIGSFVVPPAFAESMYDRRLKSHGAAGRIEVVKP